LLQNGRILAALDFVSALALAVPPTLPAPGKDWSSIEAPSLAASTFAAHMWQADTSTGGPAQVAPLLGASGSPNGPAGSDLGNGAVREQQVERLAAGPKGPGRRPAPAIEVGTGQIQTIAEALGGASPIGPSGDREATIGPEVPAERERVEAKATDRPEARQAETLAAATQAEPERPILTPAHEPLLPPSDAPAPETETDPAKTLQAGPASAAGGTAAPAPALTSGTGVTIARQTPPEALESGLARAARAPAGAPVLPAAASSTEPSGATAPAEEQPTPAGGDPIARAGELRRALAPKDGADGADQASRQERPAAHDASFGSQVRATDPSVRQQPPSDAQPGRPPQISGPHGNAVAFPHPAIGVSGEIAQLVVRAPDGALSVEPGPHPATRQVALQITKALDQDRTEIRIRLDPPELGEVDIQLEFRDLRLSASVSAERSDTLELLQRDSRSLARALREAGLELADADLSFAHNGRNDRPDAGANAQRAINLPHLLPAAVPLRDLPLTLAGPDGFFSLSDGRMDLRV
jgi:flagellar hook-length control protein FliK